MHITWEQIMAEKVLGNPIESYFWFVGIVLAGIVLKRLLSKLLSGLLFRVIKRYTLGVGVQDFNALLIKPISFLILLITFYLAFDRLEFPNHWNLVPVENFGIRMVIFRSFQAAIIISVTWVILRIIDFFVLVLHHKASLTENTADDQLVPFIKDTAKIIIASMSFFFMLGVVFHMDVRALITGLGIGGLALALAVKDSLENLISSITIFFDKPFTTGDLVKVGNIQGHVEKIGFRSTRIRTMDKSSVTVPNKKMVDAELDNLTLRTTRRGKVKIILAYNSKPAQVKQLVDQIQSYLDKHPQMENTSHSVHFTEFVREGIELTIVFFINTTDDALYMNIRQEVNLKIMEIVHNNSLQFFMPTGIL